MVPPPGTRLLSPQTPPFFSPRQTKVFQIIRCLDVHARTNGPLMSTTGVHLRQKHIARSRIVSDPQSIGPGFWQCQILSKTVTWSMWSFFLMNGDLCGKSYRHGLAALRSSASAWTSSSTYSTCGTSTVLRRPWRSDRKHRPIPRPLDRRRSAKSRPMSVDCRVVGVWGGIYMAVPLVVVTGGKGMFRGLPPMCDTMSWAPPWPIQTPGFSQANTRFCW